MKNSYDHIRDHKLTPPTRTWKSIREKMAHRKQRQKVAFYRNLSIAAGIIAIFSFTIGFTGQWNTTPLHSDGIFLPTTIEDLPVITNDPFYDYNKILVFEKVTSPNEIQNSNSPIGNDDPS